MRMKGRWLQNIFDGSCHHEDEGWVVVICL